MRTDCKAILGNLPGSFGVMAGCLAALLIVGCASDLLKPAVTVEQIVEMGQQGVPADTIIDRIKQSGAVYRLPASRLVALGEMGVPGPVLDYMQQTHFKVAGQHAVEEYYFSTRMLGK
jgi:hypothetical protein